MRRISVAVAAVFVVLLGACASSGPPDLAPIDGVIASAPGLNPDVNGRPSPVALRIYQLRAPGAFGSADFFSLYRSASSVLANDLLSTDELLIQPDQSVPYAVEVDPAARYIGVVAAFRDVGNAQWRASLALPEEGLAKFLKRQQIQITVDELSVSIGAQAQ